MNYGSPLPRPGLYYVKRVIARDTPRMEQPLSVALMVEPFLALPWLRLRGAAFLGAASFIRLALRADERHNRRRSAAKPSCVAMPPLTKANSLLRTRLPLP